MKLDPVKLNPVCSDEKLSRGLRAIDARTQRHFAIELALHLAKILGRPVRSAAVLFIRKKALFAIINHSFRPILLVYTSTNQERALRPVIEKLPAEKFHSLRAPDYVLLNHLANIFTPLFFVPLAFRFYRSSRFVKGTFCYHLSKYLSVYGWYVAARITLKKKTSLLVLSNDHCHAFCTLRHAASEEGIRTAYIQHASVTKNFPPLEFDYAILDGMDAALKYSKPGSTSTVLLAGMARRNFKTSGGNQEGKSVGICFNMLDDECFIRKLTSTLRRELPSFEFIVRLHPATPPAVSYSLKSCFEELGVRTSDARRESPTQFFEQISLLVAGNSSVVLEASLHGVQTICIFSPDAEDEYEFCKNGLAIRATDFDELERQVLSAIRCTRAPAKELLQGYDAGYGRPKYSASEQIAVTLQHLTNAGVSEDDWMEIESASSLNIFQPRIFQEELPSD